MDLKDNPKIEVLGKRVTEEEIVPYMTRDEMMTNLQKSVDLMVKEGKLPEGSTVMDVRIRSVSFLVKRPSDGRTREITALLIPQDELEESAPASFFAPGSGTKQ
jgi:hypothetical protein